MACPYQPVDSCGCSVDFLTDNSLLEFVVLQTLYNQSIHYCCHSNIPDIHCLIQQRPTCTTCLDNNWIPHDSLPGLDQGSWAAITVYWQILCIPQNLTKNVGH